MERNKAAKLMVMDWQTNTSIPEELLPALENAFRQMWQVGWEHDRDDIIEAKDSILLSAPVKSTSLLS